VKVLLVEDDLETAAYIADGLAADGIEIDHAPDGPSGLSRAAGGGYDAIVLDRLLPGRDGLACLADLRGAGTTTPVLCLTALDGLNDRVEGLEGGADDYLAKPFFLPELLARLRALVRRAQAVQSQTRLRAADVELDLIGRRVTRGGSHIALLPQEFKLLECLVRNAGNVVTRAMLLERVWNIHFDPRTSVVESHMSRLRSKLSRGVRTEYIRTIRGSGYVFVGGLRALP